MSRELQARQASEEDPLQLTTTAGPAPGKRSLADGQDATVQLKGNGATTADGVDALAAADEHVAVDAAAADAAATAKTDGKGLAAIIKLVEAGPPAPEAVVKIIDAHREERAAIFAFLRTRLGEAYVARVADEMNGLRLDVKRRELAAGDPSNPDGGFFLASAKEKGARWRTADGSFEGKADGKGLDARYHLDEDDALRLGVDAKKKEGTLGWQHDGKTVVEGFGRVDGDERALGLRRPWDLGDGRSLSTELRHESKPSGSALVAGADFKDGGTTASAHLGRHESGQIFGGVSGTHQFDPKTSGSASARVDELGRFSAGVSGSHKLDDRTTLGGNLGLHESGRVIGGISGTHQLDPQTKLDAGATLGPDNLNLSLSGSRQLSQQLGLSGSLTHAAQRDGSRGTTTLSLSERYKSPDLMHGVDLSASTGELDRFRATGTVDGRLAPNLYAGAFGSFTTERGKDPEASLGASLTFTPHEKAALTLAGVVDNQGRLETRLQLDLFKKKVDSVPSLNEQQKSALVSLFVSYSTDAPGMLNDRFGAPQADFSRPQNEGTIMGGIRIRF